MIKCELVLNNEIENDFIFSEEDGKLILLVGKNFYSENALAQEWLISNICIGFYFQIRKDITKFKKHMFVNKLVDIIYKNIKTLDPFVLFIKNDLDKSLVYLIDEIKKKNSELYLRIVNYIIDYHIIDPIEKIKNLEKDNKLDDNLKKLIKLIVIKLKEKHNVSSIPTDDRIFLPNTKESNNKNEVKGTIFEFICRNLMFNKQSNFLYDTTSIKDRDSRLYPDFIYKSYKNKEKNFYILDSKCYKDDSKIKFKEQLLYSIAVDSIMADFTEKFKIYGVILSYSKKGNSTAVSVRKKYECFGHELFIISLNIPKCIQNFALVGKPLINEIISEIIKFDPTKKTNKIELSDQFKNFILND